MNSKDPRIKQLGSLSAIFLEFTKEEKIPLTEIQDTLFNLLSPLETVNALEETFSSIKVEVENTIDRYALQKYLEELLNEPAVEGVIYCDLAGDTRIVIKSRHGGQLVREGVVDYDSTVIMSSLVITGKLIAELEESISQEPLYVNFEKTRVRVAIKIDEGYFITFLDKSEFDYSELDALILKIKEAAGLVTFYLANRDSELEKPQLTTEIKEGVFPVVREFYPDMLSAMLLSKDGKPLQAEEFAGEEEQQAGIASALTDMLSLSSVGQHQQELLVIYGKRNLTLIVDLDSRILLFKIPKTRSISDCLIKVREMKNKIEELDFGK
ncbi:MAG: hypothetical protein ACTSP4_07770, partial [Candidatus Hodarchaeales archaeon]